jgi:hypothetical protein
MTLQAPVSKTKNPYRFWFTVATCIILGLILTVGLAAILIGVYLSTGAI